MKRKTSSENISFTKGQDLLTKYFDTQKKIKKPIKYPIFDRKDPLWGLLTSDAKKVLINLHLLNNAAASEEFYLRQKRFRETGYVGPLNIKVRNINIKACRLVLENLRLRVKLGYGWKTFNHREKWLLIYEKRVMQDKAVFVAYKNQLHKKRQVNMQILDVFSTLKQPFFFPGPSLHPFMVATGLYQFTSNFIHWLWFSSEHGWGAFAGFLFMLYSICYWFRDLIIESSGKRCHTTYDNRKFKWGFFLFLASEVMFFWSFFWAFFHSSLAPGIGIYFIWPPKDIIPIKWQYWPLTNTFTLVASGFAAASLTCFLKTRLPLPKLCEYSWACFIGRARRVPVIKNFRIPIYTILKLIIIRRIKNDIGHQLYGLSIFTWSLCLYLGGYFLMVQFYEFYTAPFSINSGIYGSCFFLLTGLHGLHVIAGWVFLFVQRARFIRNHFSVENYLGIRMAIWYWHFVDIIWIIVMFWVYWWGS